jgi:hypothetical protein
MPSRPPSIGTLTDKEVQLLYSKIHYCICAYSCTFYRMMPAKVNILGILRQGILWETQDSGS